MPTVTTPTLQEESPPATGLRQTLRRCAIRWGLLPHITMNRMPFKTYEYYTLLKHVDLKPTDRVLDLGCGAGTQTLMLGRHCGSIVGVDTSEEGIATACARATQFDGFVDAAFHCGPVEELDLPAGSFDKILSFCVLEHIPNYQEVLRELHRLLAPGGDLVLSADSLELIEDAALIEKHQRENHVVNYFRLPTLEGDLIDAGFQPLALYPIFRSRYCTREFERGITRGFSYGYFQALAKYWRMRIHERLSRNFDRGLFLIAHARKPS